MDISPTQERILHSFRRYHFLTVEQVTLLHYSRGSAKFVNEVLKKMTENKYLARLDRQTVNEKIVYCLGIRGIRHLKTLGIEVNSFHPSDHTKRSHMHMSHWLSTTDFLIAAEKLPRVRPDIELAALYHDLTLKHMLTRVVPDGFIDFRAQHDQVCVWLKLDRSTEEQGDIRKKARAIVEWCNQFYTQTFGTHSINIAFATPHGDKRGKLLYQWVTQELEGEKEINWFLFSALTPGKLDPVRTFLHPIWKRYEEESLVALL